MTSGVTSSSLFPVYLAPAPVQEHLTDWDKITGCKKICTRQIDNDTVVNVFKYGDDFITESIVTLCNDPAFQQRHQETVDLYGLGMSAEQFEEIAKNKFPQVNNDGTVDFTNILWSRKSELDPTATIDGDNWSLTIANLGRSISEPVRMASFVSPPEFMASVASPLSWGGHAVLMIETIDKDGYHLWRGDALQGQPWGESSILDGQRHLLKVRWGSLECNEEGHYLPDHCPRTQTWITTKKLVQRVISQISKEAECSERNEPIGFVNGKPVIFLAPGGSNQAESDHFYNCIKWPRERIFLANIYVAPAMHFFIPQDLPNSHTHSTLLRVQQEVCGIALVGSLALAVGGLPVVAMMVPMVGVEWGLQSLADRYEQRRQFQRFKDRIMQEDT